MTARTPPPSAGSNCQPRSSRSISKCKPAKRRRRRRLHLAAEPPRPPARRTTEECYEARKRRNPETVPRRTDVRRPALLLLCDAARADPDQPREHEETDGRFAGETDGGQEAD